MLTVNRYEAEDVTGLEGGVETKTWDEVKDLITQAGFSDAGHEYLGLCRSLGPGSVLRSTFPVSPRTVVPGILQTHEYAMNLYARFGDWDTPRSTLAVAARVGRGSLMLASEAKLHLIFADSALQTTYGLGKTAMLEQLQYMRTVANLPRVTIQTVSQRVLEDNPAIDLFYLNGLDDPEPHGSQAFGGQAQVQVSPASVGILEDEWVRVSGHALSPDETLSQIDTAMQAFSK